MRNCRYAACATLAAALTVWGAGEAGAESAAAAGPVYVVPETPISTFAREVRRDPFNPPGWQAPEESPAIEDSPPVQAEPEVELRLTGIIRSGQDRLAIVNGRILAKDERAVLKRGRRSLRIHVVDVGEDEVLVSVGGQHKRLRLEHGNLGGLQ